MTILRIFYSKYCLCKGCLGGEGRGQCQGSAGTHSHHSRHKYGAGSPHDCTNCADTGDDGSRDTLGEDDGGGLGDDGWLEFSHKDVTKFGGVSGGEGVASPWFTTASTTSTLWRERCLNSDENSDNTDKKVHISLKESSEFS